MTRLCALVVVLGLFAPFAAHAQNGQPGNGINPPPGGSGMLGFLSGIYQQLTGTVNVTPASTTPTALDASSVQTGGVAVTALNAGHRARGGWLQNPVGATQPLCINEISTASGTTSSGSTTCIQPGQNYTLAPSAGAVSVISSDSSHAFSGIGLN